MKIFFLLMFFTFELSCANDGSGMSVNYGTLFIVFFIVGGVFALMFNYLKKLKRFNIELTRQADLKTRELQQTNETLEKLVQEKVTELIQKDKLLTVQSKQAVMGEMISMIAHQWRQPLSTITLQISNLQIKKMMGKINDESEYDELLEKISETIIYLSETIDDFQTYFRPDKQLTVVEIHDILYKAINFVASRAKNEQIDISILKEREILAKVYTNELIQVILNIVNNAIDALLETQKEKRKIRIWVEEHEENLQIKIEDNGSGILKENMEKLFEPYFSTKGKNGTGLGLYMSKMIIEKQFLGTIFVESSQTGTIFIIEIPKHQI